MSETSKTIYCVQGQFCQWLMSTCHMCQYEADFYGQLARTSILVTPKSWQTWSVGRPELSKCPATQARKQRPIKHLPATYTCSYFCPLLSALVCIMQAMSGVCQQYKLCSALCPAKHTASLLTPTAQNGNITILSACNALCASQAEQKRMHNKVQSRQENMSVPKPSRPLWQQE